MAMPDTLTRLNAALEGRYRVERKLGQGGMAAVFLATDLRHERQVALKVLRPDIAAALGAERFLAEIKTTANLQHPNILPLHDSGDADGLLYYVMPYVEGETLERRIARQRRIPIGEAVGIAVDVAEALHAAHEKGIVHRDVKPANILLSRGRPLVADFGIAFAANRLREERLTETGLSLGTPHYMSPEQISGEPVDGRSDVYSLACVLYEMLAGSPPFAASTGQGILAGHVAAPVPRLRAARGDISPALEAIVERGLAKLPAARWPTALEFAQALRRPMSEGLPALTGRRRMGLIAGAILGLAVLSLGLWLRPHLTGRAGVLDPNRILVFPLVVSEGFPGPTSTGEDVATMIGSALDGAGPLRWIDGWSHLPPELRNEVRRLSDDDAQTIAREKGCRRYVTGRVYAVGDSAVISLVLNDLEPGRDPVRAQATSPLEEPWRGASAVNLLLPEMIPGEAPDALAHWAERPPRAIASYLLGEAAFRRIRLEEALEHFRSAVSADSSFVLAAIRGAQAASWAHRETEAAVFLEAALREDLEPRYEAFARGYQAYLEGSADSAIGALREALSLDPEMTPAWLQLGETWTHLLPKAGVPDDSALAAFNQVIHLDSASTNALFHTIEILLRRGDTARAGPLVDRLVHADPEGAYADEVRIMLECVRLGPALIPWDDLAKEKPLPLLAASMQLSGAGAQLPCAKAGLSALLRGDTAPDVDADSRRFFALLTLQNALLAQGREAEALARVQTHLERWGSGASLFLLSAPLYESYVPRARELAVGDAARFGPAYAALEFPVRLWELGVFEARLGSPEIAGRVAEELADRARAGALPQGEELAASIEAHITLAAGDTAGALVQLESLVPAAAAGDLIRYDEALPLGAERLEYARLLAARGEYGRAIQVLDVFDSPWPAVYLLYLRPSLVLRIQAADALGDGRLKALYRARLERLDRGDGNSY
jgi:tetratricopeptide (TPR) repeat protein